MTIAMRAGVAAIAAAALAIGLSGCGSDSSGQESKAGEMVTTSETSTTSEPAATSVAPTTPPSASGPGMTIDQYVEENGIVATPVLRGDPGAPTINLPLPEGWEVAGDRGPAGAYDAIIYTAPPPTPTPATIVTFVTKLTGNVDPAKIIEYAPNETRNLPGFQGADTGEKSSLGGFDATQIGGFYPKDGVNRLVAQKTAVVPGQDGVFVIEIMADGAEDLAIPMMDATSAIDDQATITP